MRVFAKIYFIFNYGLNYTITNSKFGYIFDIILNSFNLLFLIQHLKIFSDLAKITQGVF